MIFKFRNLELKIFYLALGDFGFLNRAVVDRQSEGTNVEAGVTIKIFRTSFFGFLKLEFTCLPT